MSSFYMRLTSKEMCESAVVTPSLYLSKLSTIEDITDFITACYLSVEVELHMILAQANVLLD